MPDPALDLIALRTSPPEFSIESAERIARDHFGIDGEARPLHGERDQNFHIRPEAGDGIVLKIVGAAENPVVVEFQTAVLRHLDAVDPGLPIPRVVATRSGESAAVVRDRAGTRHFVRAVSYLAGTPLEGRVPGPGLLAEIGRVLGRLDRALRGFFHPAAGQKLVWDPRRAAELRPQTALIEPDSVRALVEQVLDRFIADLPALARLPAQIIHNDCHPGNLLVDDEGGSVVGLLDFGDMIHAPRVFEPAVPAAEIVADPAASLDSAAELLRGYAERIRLDDDEVAALPRVIHARLALNLTIHAWRRRHDPAGADKLTDQSLYAADLLRTWLAAGQDRIHAAFRAANSGLRRSPEDLVRRRRRRLGPGLELSYAEPVHFTRGDGVHLFDPAGECYLDAYNNVPSVGHANPHVAEAVARQMAELCSNTRYLHETILDYGDRLVQTLPEPLDSCLFVNSGSEANDAAWRIAKAVTGRQGALVMASAYHGITDAVAALSPYYGPQARQPAAHVRMLEPPDTYRGRFRAGFDSAGAYAEDAARAIAALDAGGHGVAAFIVDSCFTSNGILNPPGDYLARVAALVRAAGGLVIADEVQSGFGRTGDRFWGFENHGIVPDMVTLGKPMANGHPVGAVVTRPDLLTAFTERVEFFSTFGGNPVSAAAALATLEVMQREQLQENARATGAQFRRGIEALARRHQAIGDIRGRGLMIGVEIVRDRGSREPASDWSRHIVNAMRRDRVLIGIDGPHGNVLKIRPPLPFRPCHAERAIEALERALSRL
jgi:4-aminobutyrate aminotransferase-like enzyme/Ser/Thr protein kinase RdoA (MazF antagonist)